MQSQISHDVCDRMHAIEDKDMLEYDKLRRAWENYLDPDKAAAKQQQVNGKTENLSGLACINQQDVYTQAVTPKKREAQSRVVRMILTDTGGKAVIAPFQILGDNATTA